MVQKNPTIMIVEDEESLLNAITIKLQIVGLKAIACQNANQAIDILNNSSELPDAIWLDYNLPDMDGLVFMGKLKENKKWAKIPVMVVSNSASNEKVHNMLALGAKQYIIKAEHRLEDIISSIVEIINEK